MSSTKTSDVVGERVSFEETLDAVDSFNSPTRAEGRISGGDTSMLAAEIGSVG